MSPGRRKPPPPGNAYTPSRTHLNRRNMSPARRKAARRKEDTGPVDLPATPPDSRAAANTPNLNSRTGNPPDDC
jgi:hypothetical protein